MKTIVLLSGGLDSATVLALMKGNGRNCLAVGFDYGQRHLIELNRARQIAEHYATPFEIVTLPDMPRVDDVVFAGRNLVFASVAIAMAQARGYPCVAIGCNASDWLRFPDCRPAFWSALKKCAAEAYEIAVETPFVYRDKRDVVETARWLRVPIELTWSCYTPRGNEPCGECLACKTREDALLCPQS